jgi:hypothetical protein
MIPINNLLFYDNGVTELTLSNSIFLNGDVEITGLMILNFGKQIIMSHLIYFLLYLIILLCFHVISCGMLYYLTVNISRNTLHILFELDWLLKKIYLNLCIPIADRFVKPS